MLEVTVTVKRDKGEAKTYAWEHTSDSKKGIPIFTPVAETPDLYGFSKMYVKAKREVIKEQPVNGKNS